MGKTTNQQQANDIAVREELGKLLVQRPAAGLGVVCFGSHGVCSRQEREEGRRAGPRRVPSWMCSSTGRASWNASLRVVASRSVAWNQGLSATLERQESDPGRWRSRDGRRMAALAFTGAIIGREMP